MLYFFGVRTLGSNKYKITGNCLQSQFQQVLQQAGKIKELNGQQIFVDFRQRPHTFKIDVNGEGKVETHLLTPEQESVAYEVPVNLNIKDPALDAQFEGS